MLVNSKGQVVVLPKDVSSHTHPHLFADLREVKEPSQKFKRSWASIETRANFKGNK